MPCPGRQVALLQRDASSQAAQHHLPPPPAPAMHILLEKISLLRFQVPAEMRLKNVQNAVFSSFPLCVSQHVLQTGHFLIVLLWLWCAGIREAFILTGERDYKLAAGLKEPRSSLLKYLHELLGPNPGVSSRGHKHCGGGGCWVPPCLVQSGCWRLAAPLQHKQLTSCNRYPERAYTRHLTERKIPSKH